MESKFTPITNHTLSSLFEAFKDSEHSFQEHGIVLSRDEQNHFINRYRFFSEGLDFDLTYTPLNHLGRKIALSVLSEIIIHEPMAMKASLQLGVPNRISVEMAQQLIHGVRTICSENEVKLADFCITPSPGHFNILFSVGATLSDYNVGVIDSGKVLAVTGTLGDAIAGLRILQREKKAWEDRGEDSFTPNLEFYDDVVRKQLFPEPSTELFKELQVSKLNPSIYFLFDSVLDVLHRLSMRNNVGFVVDSDRLPITSGTRDVAKEMNESEQDYALKGGEDFQYLLIDDYDNIVKLQKVIPQVRWIGRVTDTNEISIQAVS